jgi:ABC-type Na+ transport system ATPase subunit NatA
VKFAIDYRSLRGYAGGLSIYRKRLFVREDLGTIAELITLTRDERDERTSELKSSRLLNLLSPL